MMMLLADKCRSRRLMRKPAGSPDQFLFAFSVTVSGAAIIGVGGARESTGSQKKFIVSLWCVAHQDLVCTPTREDGDVDIDR
ncbi:hypothetical protein M419DRAFT_78089 [Trichoderma reesei RUT C-30]|nr:hypothetical protein M419DRAFT_78089 [Trichoderma reesei RUT C-30]